MKKLISTAAERAKELYGLSYLYSGVCGRIADERKYIEKHSQIYEVAYYLTDWCRQERLVTFSRGTLGNSIVAYLNRMTSINPLIAHYYCPSCGHIELQPSYCVKDGFDLPKKVCSECGCNLFADGHNLPFAIHEKEQPDITINVSKIRFDDIKELFDCMGYYVETVEKYVFKIYPKEELIDDYVTVIGNEWCDIYSQMINKTSYMPNDFPASDSEVVKKSELIADIFGSSNDEQFLELQKTINPNKFSDYARLLGLLWGTEVYDDMLDVKSVFYNADDKYMKVEWLHGEERAAGILHPEVDKIDLSKLYLNSVILKQLDKKICICFLKLILFRIWR